eukprot:GHVQ01017627.1.p1 GENE.GHVQ01017627.1~~GHVQ01017627.1.p1  ORF type:complete len:865 (-),score=112.32 GHVQ01017627.1:231-2825(-)
MVAEKPSIAETLATALSDGSSRKRRGVSPVCGVFEYDGVFRGESAFFKVTSTAGHVYTTDFPKRYNNWDTTDPVELFDAEVVKIEANANTRLPAHIVSESKGVDHLVLWLDCDREGENICFEVIRCATPNMNKHRGGGGGLSRQTIWRAHFSALAPSDLKRAMNNLVEPNENESNAVDARQELDLKVGCAFTRFQTRYFQGKYGDLDSSCISYGPCQTPTLQFCVKRHDEITTFQPETFYTLDVMLEVGEQELWLEWSRGRVFDQVIGHTFKDIVASGDGFADIKAVTSRDDCKARPQALNTVALLKAASQFLGIGPHQALHVAEGLYLSGYITYPRTETSKYPSSFDLSSCVQQQTKNPYWGQYATQLLQVGLNKTREGTDAGDHPPITPVRSATESDVGGGDSWRVYELVCRHFLASVSRDCRFLILKTTFDIRGEVFELKGRKIVDAGFTKVLKEGGEMMDVIVPVFKVGERSKVGKVAMGTGKTSPPPYLSESDLLTLMEKHGVGTDASMPTHINNITERNYVTLAAERRLIPTRLGIALTHGYMMVDPELVLPKVRSTIEQLVDLIAKGKADMQSVVQHSLAMFTAKFEYFVKKVEVLDGLFEATFTSLSKTGEPLSRCGSCQRYMKLIIKQPVRLHCGHCEVTYNLPRGGSIKLYKELKCPLDNFELVLFSVKGGKTYPLCPMCYNDPPFGDSVQKKMSCLECLHPTCKHSLSAKGVCQCPQEDCRGVMCLDVLSAPKWKLDCNTCNYQLRLMESAHKILVSPQECDDCGSSLLDITFNKTKPLPDGSLNRVGCIACDPQLNGLIESSFVRTYQKGSVKRSGGGGRGRGGRGRGRGGGRGGRGAKQKNVDPRMTFDQF